MTKTSSPLTKRPVVIVVATFVAALAAGCSGGGPARTAQNYVDNLKLYNYPACYQSLSHQDQLDRTMDQFLTKIPLAPDVSRDWFKGVLQAVEFQIGETKQEGDNKAVVTVKVTGPDLPLWERTINATIAPEQGPDQAAQKSMQEKSFPKLTYDDNIVVIKEAGQWRLLVDFPAKDEIRKKHKDAVEAYHKHDYDKAIAMYQAVLADLDKEEATGNAGYKFLYQRELEEVQNVKNQIPEGQAYIPKLALSEVDMKMSASRVPGIFGKITNNGDKGIDEVVCTVTYTEGKAKKKKTVYSEEHTILVTPLQFMNFSRPVLPFVPGETRSFGFKLTAPAEIQQKASPDLEITGVVFTQSKAPLPKPPAQPSPTATPAPGASGAAPGAAGGSMPLPPPPPPPPAH